MSSSSPKTPLEAQLEEAGNKLLDPPSSLDELLHLLDHVELILSKVEQSPAKSLLIALSPLEKALVSDKLFRHKDEDVRVSVAACISEITRITAPDAPYDDDEMREVFQLIVSSFQKLSDNSSRSYSKRAMILETLAKVRSCVVMLDLECDELLNEMFQIFFKAIRDYHPESIFTSMETIMALVLEESEDIPFSLLAPLLSSVKLDDEGVLPKAKQLAEGVLEKSALKLKPILKQAVNALGLSLDNLSAVVTSICQGTSDQVEQNNGNASNIQTIESAPSSAQPNEATVAQVDGAKQASGSSHSTAQADGDKQAPTSSDVAASVAEDVKEVTCHEDADPAQSKSSKSTMINGHGENVSGEVLDDAGVKSNIEEAKHPDISQGTFTAESDESEPEKLVKPKTELITEKQRTDSNLQNSTEPSQAAHVGGEKEAEELADHLEDCSKDSYISSGEDAAVGDANPSNKDGIDIQLSPPKLSEQDGTNVSPSQSECVPAKSPPKKTGRSGKKKRVVKQETPLVDAQEVSDSAVKQQKRRSKMKASDTTKEDNNLHELDTSDNEGGPPSGSATKSSGEGVATEDANPSDNKDDIGVQLSPPKASEQDDSNVSPSQSDGVPAKSPPKKTGRPGKKKGVVKQEAQLADATPKKTSEEASDSAVKQQKRRVKIKVSETTKVENSLPELDISNNEGGLLSRSGKKSTGEGAAGEDGGIQLSPPKSSEQDDSNVSPSESESLPVKSPPKKTGKRGKKKRVVKHDTPRIDTSLKKTSEEASDSAVKQQKRSKIKGSEASKEDNSLPDISNKEGVTLSGSGRKSSDEKGVASNQDDSRSPPEKIFSKKRGRGRAISEKDDVRSSVKDNITKSIPESDVKELSPKSPPISPIDDDNQEDETPMLSSKRRRSAKSNDSEYGQNIVGSRVKVWWPMDKMFYEGHIDSFDSVKKKHKVVYDDGEVEVLNLTNEKFELVEDKSMEEADEGTEAANRDDSSELQKRRKKNNAESSAKQGKMETSPKSGGTPKLKGSTTKSGRTSKDDGTTVPKDNAVKSGGKSGDDSSSKTKPKLNTPKIASKSKQETPRASGTRSRAPQGGGKSSSNVSGKGSKGKETVAVKDKSIDTAKTPESGKRKLADAAKEGEKETKSGKKRGRVLKG